MAVNDLYISA